VVVTGTVTTEREVALTIDDVGAAQMRPLVDALVGARLHATLFCIGSEMNERAAKYAVANGMELGNHSWDHTSIAPMDAAHANRQIMMTETLIHSATGVWPIWYRMPFQSWGARGLKDVQAADMLAAGVSNNQQDYRGWTGPLLAYRIGADLAPGQIILLHALPGTIATLPQISNELRLRHYRALELSSLAAKTRPALSTADLAALHSRP